MTFTPWPCIHTTALCRSAHDKGLEMYSSASGAMSITVSATKVPWPSPPTISQFAKLLVGWPTPV